jgi:hypothetical protein
MLTNSVEESVNCHITVKNLIGGSWEEEKFVIQLGLVQNNKRIAIAESST